MAERSLTLDAFLPYRLSYTAALASEVIATAYRALFGLGIPEWRVIAHVAEGAGVTQQAIGIATRMDKVTVSRAATALSARGLIERRPNPADRRSHLMTLTEAGRVLYAEVAPKALEFEETLFAGFDARELAAFTRVLRRIDTAALAALGERRPGQSPG